MRVYILFVTHPPAYEPEVVGVYDSEQAAKKRLDVEVEQGINRMLERVPDLRESADMDRLYSHARRHYHIKSFGLKSRV